MNCRFFSFYFPGTQDTFDMYNFLNISTKFSPVQSGFVKFQGIIVCLNPRNGLTNQELKNFHQNQNLDPRS